MTDTTAPTAFDFEPATSQTGRKMFTVLRVAKNINPSEEGSDDKPKIVRPSRSRVIHTRGKKQ
ncbi:MAG: hypothetical protein PHN19_05375 [Patescibacteria group bacterium]|nr:hypothetical protein [Patescibacteria group bacterium]